MDRSRSGRQDPPSSGSRTRRWARALGTAALVLAMGGAWTAPDDTVRAADASIRFTRILSGYTRPVLVTSPPGVRKRLYVVEQIGTIRTAVKVDGAWVKEGVFLDLRTLVSDPTVEGSAERGLLGLAFPPDHATTGRFYVSYTQRHPTIPWEGGESVLAEYRRTSAAVADPASARIVTEIDQPYANHNGGGIAFGPDGLLYLGLGDGGFFGDPEDRAQDLGSPLGKLLRIDPADPDGDGPRTYRIPADNPFVGVDGALPEIWSLGLRNPWRFSFDRLTGDLLIGDVGEDTREEIDRSRATGGRGAGRAVNWGWDRCEGDRTFPAGAGCDHAALGFARPLHTYGHTGTGPMGGGCSVTGGHVMRGPGAPAWQGIYLFGDLCTGKVSALGQGGRRLLTVASRRAISSFGEDGAGRLYLVDMAGSILQLGFVGDPTP